MGERGMNDEDLRDQWRETAGAPPPDRDGCPAPELLLELADRGLVAAGGGEEPGPDRNRLLLHLARCSTCREDVAVAGALLRAARGEEAEASSPNATGSDGPRDASGPRRPTWRRGHSLALAASLVLAVGLGVMARWVGSGGADRPVLRGGDADLPAAVATCSEAGIVEIRWPPFAGVERYRVEIFTEVGDLVLEEQVSGTSTRLVLPEGSPPAGAALLHIVEAELAGGTILTSAATALPPGCLPPR